MRPNPAMTADALRRAANVPSVGARQKVRMIIEFCPETGECEITAPANPLMFYGILKIAEKTFDRMQQQPAPPAPPANGNDGGQPK